MNKTLNQDVANWLWSEHLEQLPFWKQKLVMLARYVYVLADDFLRGQLTLRAMSLVYTTLLSLVPLLAVAFSVLKAMGIHNRQLEPLLLTFLEPMGDRGQEITDQIIGFIDNANIGVLGALGLAFLFYAAISLVHKIESAFNDVWHLERNRSFGRRFADYGSVIMIGPVLVFSAIGFSASVLGGTFMQEAAEMRLVGGLVAFFATLTPYLLIVAAFTFLYMFVPNTRVTFRAGLIAGAVSGVMWQTLGWGFGSVVVAAADSGTGTYALYSGFAVLILFMIWLYISWLILLIGSSISFYVQHPAYVIPYRRDGGFSIQQQETLALQAMALIAQQYYARKPALTASELGRRLRVPLQGIQNIADVLENAGLIGESAEDPPRFLPRVPLEQTSVKVVLDTIRAANSMVPAQAHSWIKLGGVDALSARIDAALVEAIADTSIKDMALGEDAEAS